MTKKRKLLAAAIGVGLAILLIPLFAAFEAHTINVTAHIENALTVSPLKIRFGTVFPEEVLVQTFTVDLSDSFREQNRATDVHYRIVQIEKVWTPESGEPLPNPGTSMEGRYYDLRPYLLKRPIGPSEGDTETAASLNLLTGDISDTWRVVLRVPPIQGAVGRDWVGFPNQPDIAPAEGDYGADVVIEVVGISYGTISDLIIDANDMNNPWHGVPAFVDATPGVALTDFAFTAAGGSGVDMIDRDGDGKWSFGDDLFNEETRFGGIRNGVYDLGFDKPMLDLNADLANGTPVSFDLDGSGPALKLRYFDRNGNGEFDNGEDIVFDANNNYILD